MKKLSVLIGLFALATSMASNASSRLINCNVFPTPEIQAKVMEFVLDRLVPGDVLRIAGTCVVNVTIPADVIDITLDGENVGVLNGPDGNSDTLRIEGTGIVVKNLEITGGRDGVHIHWGGQAQQDGVYGLEGNNIHHTGRNGVGIHSNAGSRFGNNVIADNPGWGVMISENSEARVGIKNMGDIGDGNTIVRNGNGGVYVQRSSTAHIVSNTITDNAGPGVEISRGSYAQVVSNTIQGNGLRGVSIGGGSAARIANNDISQNDVAGVRINKNSNATLGGNSSSLANVGHGVECFLASLMDGALDGLAGTMGVLDTDGTCTEVLSDYP